MKTIVILYMPGHAGNFLARLFGLSQEVIPLLTIQQLTNLTDSGQGIDHAWDKLNSYKFSKVFDQFDEWQHYHAEWADYRHYSRYRLLNLFSGRKFQNVIHCIHPHEMHQLYAKIEPEQFFHVDLDLSIWHYWWQQERQRLKFRVRPYERIQFDKLKQQHQTNAINLTAMLHSADSFLQEYVRVCEIMSISTELEPALILRNDWYQTRVACYE